MFLVKGVPNFMMAIIFLPVRNVLNSGTGCPKLYEGYNASASKKYFIFWYKVS